MKIRINILLASLLVFFISSTSLSQTDTTRVDSNKITLDPQFSGAHFEACYILLGVEAGALLDIDMIRNKKTQSFSLGYRVSFEYYWYGNPGGGPGHKYLDVCFYVRPALRFNWFWINFLGGYSFHTDFRNDESEGSSRFGIEFKFNVFRKYVALLLKSSFSVQSESGFVGVGISLGYFN